MNYHGCSCALIGGALLALALVPPAGAEGTFDMPPGAHFNPQKLEKSTNSSATKSRPARFQVRSC